MAVTSGPDGMAAHTDQHNFSRHTLRLLDRTIVRQDRQYRFARWAGQRDPDQAFRATVRGLPMRADYTITAAFSIWCPVTPRFADQHGRVLDPAQIAQVTVRSDTGQPASLRLSGDDLFHAPGPSPGAARCAAKTCSTRCRASWCPARTSSTRASSAGRLRTRAPTIVGYFHDLTITAHDALFGGGTGQEALVTPRPYGVVAEPFGPGHAATLSNLPQGSYQVRVKAGGAIVSAQTLRLSRDVTVDLTAVSPIDLVALGGGLFAAVVGLPLLSGSRRRWVAGRLRRIRKGQTLQKRLDGPANGCGKGQHPRRRGPGDGSRRRAC